MANIIRVVDSGQTIGATTTDIINYAIPNNTVCICKVKITGRTSTMDVIAFSKIVTFKCVANIVSIVGGTNLISPHKDAALSSAAMIEAIIGQICKFTVTGVAGKIINWMASMDVYWDQ